MKDELNHLIEYYSVLRKSLEMVFENNTDANEASEMSMR